MEASLLDCRDQGLRGSRARLEEAGEAAPSPELGDLQRDPSRPPSSGKSSPAPFPDPAPPSPGHARHGTEPQAMASVRPSMRRSRPSLPIPCAARPQWQTSRARDRHRPASQSARICRRSSSSRFQGTGVATRTIPTIGGDRQRHARRRAAPRRRLRAASCTTRGNTIRDPVQKRRVERLASVPTVGQLTALMTATDLAELGSVSARQIAALAGLAPVAQQSGRQDKPRRIQGGRPWVLRSPNAPNLVASRFSPDLERVYGRFIGPGKCQKVVLTPVMRKLVILANTLIAGARRWSPAAS